MRPQKREQRRQYEHVEMSDEMRRGNQSNGPQLAAPAEPAGGDRICCHSAGLPRRNVILLQH
jgi:hypothetical protein